MTHEHCATETGGSRHVMRVRRMGIDTYHEPVIYMHRDCSICRSEGFQTQARIRVECGERSLIATLNVMTDGPLAADEAGLSEAAWRRLQPDGTGTVTLSHPAPLDSMSFVRGKIYGERLTPAQMDAIIRDVAAGRYSDVQLASFVTACAGDRMDFDETVSLTQSMINAGARLHWKQRPVVDKHCVGGLPGNRTSMIVVPVLAAYGLTIPKTSSRAITSPAGTADTMETLAPVNLDIEAMRRVVERENGCIVWGGAVQLSPADDILIGVERPLDLDSEGQLVASILSKKAAAGSTHVVIDIPAGETAKVRSHQAAKTLGHTLTEVGRAVGLAVKIVISEGREPVGRGIGPALEAFDVLSVLQNNADAPRALKERSLVLAASAVAAATETSFDEALRQCRAILDDGRAWKKFQAICEAQGGMKEPKRASLSQPVLAMTAGIVSRIDNRRLARVAKLAGAPHVQTAGAVLHTPLGTRVAKGQPLFTLYAESPGELSYALNYAGGRAGIVQVFEE